MEKKDVSKFSENFVKDYDESLDKGYILEVGIEYPKILYNLHNDLPFLSKRMKIKKCHRLESLWYRKICCKNKNFKTALYHGLILDKV